MNSGLASWCFHGVWKHKEANVIFYCGTKTLTFDSIMEPWNLTKWSKTLTGILSTSNRYVILFVKEASFVQCSTKTLDRGMFHFDLIKIVVEAKLMEQNDTWTNILNETILLIYLCNMNLSNPKPIINWFWISSNWLI